MPPTLHPTVTGEKVHQSITPTRSPVVQVKLTPLNDSMSPTGVINKKPSLSPTMQKTSEFQNSLTEEQPTPEIQEVKYSVLYLGGVVFSFPSEYNTTKSSFGKAVQAYLNVAFSQIYPSAFLQIYVNETRRSDGRLLLAEQQMFDLDYYFIEELLPRAVDVEVHTAEAFGVRASSESWEVSSKGLENIPPLYEIEIAMGIWEGANDPSFFRSSSTQDNSKPIVDKYVLLALCIVSMSVIVVASTLFVLAQRNRRKRKALEEKQDHEGTFGGEDEVNDHENQQVPAVQTLPDLSHLNRFEIDESNIIRCPSEGEFSDQISSLGGVTELEATPGFSNFVIANDDQSVGGYSRIDQTLLMGSARQQWNPSTYNY